jgi:hypothetical protein
MTKYLTRAHFPEVGKRRYFEVKHNPKSVTKPVVIELREYLTEKQVTSLSRLIGLEYTIADRDEIVEAAKRLDARVGRIDDVVGVY